MISSTICALAIANAILAQTFPPAPKFPHDTIDIYGVIPYPFQTKDLSLLSDARVSKQRAEAVLAKSITNYKSSPSMSSYLAMVHISRRAKRSQEVLTSLGQMRKEAWSKRQVGAHTPTAIASLNLCYAHAVLGSYSKQPQLSHDSYNDILRLLSRPLTFHEKLLYAMSSESRGNYDEVHSELLSLINETKSAGQRREVQLAYAVSLKKVGAPPEIAERVFKETRAKKMEVFYALSAQYPDWGEAA